MTIHRKRTRKSYYKSPRRSSREAEYEVIDWFIEFNKPVRWIDLQKKAEKARMASKVLSAVLKRLIIMRVVNGKTIPTEKSRLRIHYYLDDIAPLRTLFLQEQEKATKRLNKLDKIEVKK